MTASARDVLEGRERWAVDQGDALAWLCSLPDACVHCWITSPPYYGLRSYLRCPACKELSGQPVCKACGHLNPDKALEMGSEATQAKYIAKLIEVLREARRVLRPDGVLWLNLGDAYTNSGKTGGHSGNKNFHSSQGGIDRTTKHRGGKTEGQRMLLPHRVALALQADGWRLRQEVIWSKRNPMCENLSGVHWARCRVKIQGTSAPNNNGLRSRVAGHWVEATHPRTRTPAKYEPCPGCPKCSATDGWVLRRGRWRNTTAHEYIFMLTPGSRYFCDGEAAKEASIKTTTGKAERKVNVQPESRQLAGSRFTTSPPWSGELRNPRSVWTLSSDSFKGAHFATFPSELPRRCIEASTSAAGCCPACGSCWAPMVERERVVATRPGTNSKVLGTDAEMLANRHGQRLDREGPYTSHNGTVFGNRDPQRHLQVSRVLGYRPTCSCDAGPAVPCIVGDMYTGSGTVAQVATWLGRRFIGSELNVDYLPLIVDRVAKMPRCLRPKKVKAEPAKDNEPMPLWE